MKKSYERVCDLAHLEGFAQEILNDIGNEGIVLLRGDLASGKTAFIKAFAHVLGIAEPISSPTFSILHEYDDILFHYDIYQCKVDGFLKSGLMEKLDCRGYHMIEWAGSDFEALLKQFSIPFSTIDITPTLTQRTYKVTIHAHA